MKEKTCGTRVKSGEINTFAGIIYKTYYLRVYDHTGISRIHGIRQARRWRL